MLVSWLVVFGECTYFGIGCLSEPIHGEEFLVGSVCSMVVRLESAWTSP